MLLYACCMGMKIDAARNLITFSNTTLPAFLREVTLTNLRVNKEQVALQIRRTSEGVEVRMLSPRTGVEIRVLNRNTPEHIPA